MRVKDPRAEPARMMYLEGMKLVEIAKELQVPEGTVRRWKHDYEWDLPPSKRSAKAKAKPTPIPKPKPKSQKKKTQKKKEEKQPEIEEINEEEIPKEPVVDKVEYFAYEYLKCFNATKAYRATFGTTYETAHKRGFLYLREPEVQQRIKEIKEADLTAKMICIDDVVKGFVDIAFNQEKADNVRIKALEWLAEHFMDDRPDDDKHGTGVVMLGEIIENENYMDTTTETEAVPEQT